MAHAESAGDFLDKLLTDFPKREVRVDSSMVLNGEEKYVEVTVSTAEHKEHIELVHLTDLQYGSIAFKRKRFLEYRDWILASPHRLIVLGGDVIDAATVLSVGSPFDNTGEPIDQVQDVVVDLKPLRGRIIGYVGGNHERRTKKTFGDCGRLIATLLKVPYSGGVQHIDIHYGKHRPFRVSMHHGVGSARTKGGRMQMLHRFMAQGDSQLYLVGHLHDVVATYDWRQQRENGKIVLKKIAGVMSSSFQEYWNTYAETFMLTPSDTMMARTIIEVNGKWEITLR